MKLSSLAQLAIDAAGGLDRWRQFETISARLEVGGVLWPLKHQQGVLDDVRVRVDQRKEWASHRPFGAPDLRTATTRITLSGPIEADRRTDLALDAESSDLAVADELLLRLRRALGTAAAQPAEVGGSGTFHGKTEVMEHLGRLAEKSPTVNIKRLIAEGDTVVAITDVSAGGETGEDADVFTIRNGKTVRMEVHGDTALIERVYGKKQLAAG